MQTQFKEKTYEKYFGSELARRTNIIYSPDQCDEAFLGFDDAFYLPLSFARVRLPYMRRRRWRNMYGVSIRELENISPEMSRRMPPFRFNLFVQYKRPEYLSRASAQEWSCWDAPYYRYAPTPHQHEILRAIEQQSHGRASTVYASPAFWLADDLWTMVEEESVVENSNIVNVASLNNHSRFTYVSAGNKGKGAL